MGMVLLEEGIKVQKELIEKNVDFLKKIAKFNEMLISPPEVKVGQTPHDIVYRKHKVKLLRYRGEKVYNTPVLIAYALVNKPYIMDLLPGRSIIELLVSKGFDVFLIDWGTPTESDKKNGLDKYINFYLDKMVDKVMEISEVEKINLLGYCMGGTMSLMYTALNPEKIKNLVIMATPFDSGKNDGILYQWSKEFPVEEIEKTYGNCPGWFLETGFSLLNPMNNIDKILSFYKGMLDDVFLELFFAMEKWIHDTVPLSGRTYTEFMKGIFQENLLVKNQFVLGGKKVDLKNIACPILNLVADEDTSVPPSSSTGIGDYTSSKDKELLTCPVGHIGLSVSGKALKKLWPKAIEWLIKRS